jgi:hypothetical protein
MKTSISLGRAMTFTASVLVGCGAAIAIASAAAVSQAAPSLRTSGQAAPEIVRLEPVVVTVSKGYFERVRSEETALVRAAEARKVTRG